MLRKRTLNITIIEDDDFYNKALLQFVLTTCGSNVNQDFEFNIKSYGSAHEFIDEYSRGIDILILDYYLSNEDDRDRITGADLVNLVRKNIPGCKVIMISSQDDPKITQELLQKGVYEYVDKNLNTRNRIGAIVQKILDEETRA